MSTKPTSWVDTMTPAEVEWCRAEIDYVLATRSDEFGHYVDNHRAARYWVSSQRRRFIKLSKQGCCGSYEWLVKKWNWRRLRYDIYWLGFNYGH